MIVFISLKKHKQTTKLSCNSALSGFVSYNMSSLVRYQRVFQLRRKLTSSFYWSRRGSACLISSKISSTTFRLVEVCFLLIEVSITVESFTYSFSNPLTFCFQAADKYPFNQLSEVIKYKYNSWTAKVVNTALSYLFRHQNAFQATFGHFPGNFNFEVSTYLFYNERSLGTAVFIYKAVY